MGLIAPLGVAGEHWTNGWLLMSKRRRQGRCSLEVDPPPVLTGRPDQTAGRDVLRPPQPRRPIRLRPFAAGSAEGHDAFTLVTQHRSMKIARRPTMAEQARERVHLVEHPATTIAEEEELASEVVAPATPIWALPLDEVFDDIIEWGRIVDE